VHRAASSSLKSANGSVAERNLEMGSEGRATQRAQETEANFELITMTRVRCGLQPHDRSAGRVLDSERPSHGNVHCRCRTQGNRAASRTPVSTARRLVHDGHHPLPLQQNATTLA
jgi:hypothetical protein